MGLNKQWRVGIHIWWSWILSHSFSFVGPSNLGPRWSMSDYFYFSSFTSNFDHFSLWIFRVLLCFEMWYSYYNPNEEKQGCVRLVYMEKYRVPWNCLHRKLFYEFSSCEFLGILVYMELFIFLSFISKFWVFFMWFLVYHTLRCDILENQGFHYEVWSNSSVSTLIRKNPSLSLSGSYYNKIIKRTIWTF